MGNVPRHRFERPTDVTTQLLRGYSLPRSLLHLALSRIELRGKILDLGSKTAAVSYYEYLKRAEGSSIVFTDLNPGPGVIAADIEKTLPFGDETFDAVVAFHLFEHVFDLSRVPAEIWRILRPGGRLLVAVPFLHEYHADPDDYHRLTDSALRRMHEQHGFRTVSIDALGEGPLTLVATKLASIALPPFVRALANTALYACSTGFDRLLAFRPDVAGRSLPVRFAMEHLAVFEKPVER
jgi:SAM-dependent methyltransferase